MSNNGFILSGLCLTPSQYASSLTASSPLCNIDANHTSIVYLYKNGTGAVACQGTFGFKNISNVPVYNCEVDGPPLNATQQVQASNIIFAALLVALCIIWGAKMLYNTLILNPRSES